MDYGKHIKQLRNEAGMTQAQLAEASGIRQSTISMIETGVNTPNVKTADKIARALGVTLNDLMPD